MKKRSFWTPTHVVLILTLLLDLLGPLVKEPVHPLSIAVIVAAIVIAYRSYRHPGPRKDLARFALFVTGILCLVGGLFLPRNLVEPIGMILSGLSFLPNPQMDSENG